MAIHRVYQSRCWQSNTNTDRINTYLIWI
jgi:hypothetical protein